MAINEKSKRGRFAVFRAKDARGDADVSIMQYESVSDVVAEGSRKAYAEGVDAGHDLRVLFSAPGFSLVYAWFKSGFPLPLHTHDVDCLYYIVGGSLKLGHKELGRGDGFFIGSGVPYTYTPGPAGVEVLEFRASNHFNIKVMAEDPAFWEKAVETVRSQRPAWLNEARPAGPGIQP
jgi:hypothetical protein